MPATLSEESSGLLLCEHAVAYICAKPCESQKDELHSSFGYEKADSKNSLEYRAMSHR